VAKKSYLKRAKFAVWALAAVTLVVIAGFCLLGNLEAQEDGRTIDAVTPDTRAAIAKALDFLKTRQNQDGSFGASYHLANTSLAGLAFLGNGNSYNRGPYGEQVKKALDYILRMQDKWGYIDDHQCRMHGHGYATLFLAQVYGMLPPEYQKRVYTALDRSCKVVMDSQTHEGGWYYYPSHSMGYRRSMSDEGSITITVVQGIRAARNAGLNVPRSVIEKGIKYIQRCMTPQGCQYTLNSSRKTYTLTAAAVSVLNASGVYKSKALDMGMNFMRKRIAGVTIPLQASEWPWYGNLYAVQAMWQAGGRDWETFYPKSYEHLLQTQRPNGSWSGARGGWGSGYGDVFSTSIGALMLEVPLGYLPIFEK
jgi:hypothetical protein